MWLLFKSGDQPGRAVEVTGESFSIGRDESCDLPIRDEKLSRRHATLRALPDGKVVLEDLGSTNGTYVKGWRADRPVLLEGGEQVQFGDTVLETSLAEPAAGGKTVFGATVQPPGGPAPAAQQPQAPFSPSGRSQSAIHRLVLQRSVRRATVLAIGASLIAAVAVVLAVTGVLTGGSGKPSVEDIVTSVTPSTVLIRTSRDGSPVSGGTGWVLDAQAGLVVTNNHVVNGGDKFEVGVKQDFRDAEIRGAAPCEDLVVLQVKRTSGLKTLPLAKHQTDLRRGQTVVAVGYPGSASLHSNLTATSGIVSVARTTFDERSIDTPHYRNVIQTDAAINPGNSGGPLVNLDTELVGVNTAVRTLDQGQSRIIQGQGYAIGVDRVRKVTRDLRRGRSLAWAGLGLGSSLSGQTQTLPSGLIVTDVVPGTEAAKEFGTARLLITAIDGETMDGSLAAYCQAVGDKRGGDSATFTVTDGNRTANVELGFE